MNLNKNLSGKEKKTFLSWLIDAKNKLVSFLSKHIKTIYAIVAFVCVFLAISLLNFAPKYEENIAINYGSDIGVGKGNYQTVTTADGKILYTPLNADPSFYLDCPSGTEFNAVIINFAEPIKTISPIQIYYSIGGEDLSESNSVFGMLSNDGMSAVIELPQLSSYSYLRIDINSEFVLDGIFLPTRVLLGIGKSLNIFPAITLFAILVLLAVFEKRFGFFKTLAHWFKNQVLTLKEMLNNKDFARLIVRASLILSLLALAASYLIILTLALMTRGLIIYLFIVTSLAIGLFIADRLLSGKAQAPVIFLVIAILFGSLISAVLPITISNSWDEEYHYARCVDVKCVLFGGDISGADVYQMERRFALTTDLYISDPGAVINDLLIRDCNKCASNVSGFNFYKYIGHIPGAFAMALGDITGLNYFAKIVVAKMANVLVYAFVIYFGLKRLKSGAYLFSAICLLPTTVFLAASFSYDYFTNAMIAFACAFFISELQQPEKKLSVKDTALMLGAMILGCGPKAIYFLLIFPMLFMGKNKFETKRRYNGYRFACLGVMLLIALTFVLPFVINTDSSTDLRGGEDVSSGGQIKYILSNPIAYTKTLIKFMGNYVSFNNATSFATSYSYVGFASYFCGTLALCIIAFCTLTDKSEEDGFKGAVTLKGISLVTVFVQIALFATALYVSFTPVGSDVINGCQWRYVIPVLFLSLYSLGSHRICNRHSKKFMSGFVFTALTVNLIMTFYQVYVSKVIAFL